MDDAIVVVMTAEEAMKTLCVINDGDCALLYAYAAALGGTCRLSDAAVHTGFEDRRIQRAAGLLNMYKVCRPAGVNPEPPREGYSPAELLAAQRTDPAFRGVCDYLEQSFGRPIRRSEIEILYGIYDKLNMQPDVIMLLINYCRSSERLSARELEKRAYEWHDAGITTYDAAADKLDENDRLYSRSRRVLSIFGISGRSPSETELKYIRAWLEMNMSDQLIKMAYDRTVMRTGKLQWKYLHRILEDWHSKGYKNRRQVEQAEGPAKGASEAAPKKAEISVTEAVTRAFDERREARERMQAAHLTELREKSPEFAENEVELRGISVRLARASLPGRGDEAEGLEEARRDLLSRRAVILASLGLDESYISPKPDCEKCGDTGYVNGEVCDCFRKACAAEEQRRKKLSAL